MKVGFVFLAFFTSSLLGQAKNEPLHAQKLQEGQTEFTFYNNRFNLTRKDSVLVIYDRYDRSGAGVIRKVFYPGKKQSILVDEIPAGKYFVTIQCLGKHHDRFEKVLRIKSGKTSTIPVNLSLCEEYSKEKVVIPNYPVDFSRLSILKMK
jgi:hypothetical protein